MAIVLGAIGGLVTVGFIRAMEGGKDLLWSDLPDALDVDPTTGAWIVPVVLVGAVLLGLARRFLGEYPVSLEQAIDDHRRDGEFDHRHIGQALVISLLSLCFGAALGPEAALMAVLGGIGSWIARVIDVDEAEREGLPFVGIAAALGALFTTAGAALLVLSPRSTDADDARSGRIWWLIPALAAAGAGLFVYRHLGESEHYFDLGIPSYDLAAADLGWALPVVLAGMAVAAVFLVVGRVADQLLSPLAGRHVVQSVVGGLALAGLASWSSLVLFSGHQGTDRLIAEYGTDDAGFLVAVAVAKVVAAALLLSTQWKGGRFFPLMFAGAAVGLALAMGVDGIGEVVGVAAGMTAAVGVLLRRPVLTVGFMIWFFPPSAWPIVVLAGVVSSLVGARFGPLLTGEDETTDGPGASASAG